RRCTAKVPRGRTRVAFNFTAGGKARIYDGERRPACKRSLAAADSAEQDYFVAILCVFLYVQNAPCAGRFACQEELASSADVRRLFLRRIRRCGLVTAAARENQHHTEC